MLRSEEVARQLEQAFAALEPASKATTREDKTVHAYRNPASSTRAQKHIAPPQPQDIGVRDINLPPHDYVLPKPPNAQDLLKMLEEVDPPGEAQARTAEKVEVEDEDEIWKKFVFDGDRAEISRKAYAQAREKTKQELLELIDPADSDVADAPSSAIPDMRSTTSDHTSSRNLLEDPPNDDTPSLTSIAATGAASATSSAIPTTMTSATSLTAEAGSSSTTSRFHQPTPFIGRLASTVPPPKRPRSPNKRPRGRPRKKRDFRRPNIRTMPNFEEDPIESSDSTDRADDLDEGG